MRASHFERSQQIGMKKRENKYKKRRGQVERRYEKVMWGFEREK